MRKPLIFGLVFLLLISFVSAIDPTDLNLLYWSFDNDDYSAPILNDLSPRNIDGTNNLATTGQTGKLNQSFLFDGNDIIQGLPLNLTSEFTICFWIKLTDTADNNQILLWKSNSFGFGTGQLGLGIGTNGKYNFFYYDTTWRNIVSTTSLSSNWVFICAKKQTTNNTILLYINNVLEATVVSSSAIASNTNNVMFSLSSYYAKTYADETFISSFALSNENLTQLYNSGNGCNPYKSVCSSSVVPYFELTAKNVYNSTTITNFTANITNSTGTYEIITTNGTIYFGIDGLLDIEIFNAPNYFDASFLNINSSSNYQASLIPSIFPIYARTNVSNTTITNFTATIFNSSFSETATTTSGILYLPYDIGQTYFINVSAPLYATTNTTISNINATFNYTYYLQNNNSIFITIYDAKTNDLINFSAEPISIFFTGNNTGTYYEESTLNGTFQKNYMPSDYYTITLFNSNYYEQTYFVTLNDNEHKTLSAYLLNSTYVAITTTKIINAFGENIENALITLQENIGGSYVTITQKYTDTTGNALFYLKIGTQYRAIVDKTGYVSQTATITPTQNPYSVTILLQDTETQTPINYFECLSIYQKTPSYIYGNMTDFGLWVHSPTSELSYFGIYFNSTNLTNSSVITGGTLTLSVNMSDYSQAIIGFFFKCSGQPEYWENVTYYINTPIENVSIEAGIDLINDKIESEVGVAKQDILRIFIIIAIILFFILIAWDIGVPAISYGFIAEGIIIIFTFIGWIPVLIAVLLGVVFIGGSILSIIGEGQNYG